MCFPYAGAGVNMYRGWVGLFPPAIELAAVLYPGREDRYGEPFVTDMEAMASQIAEAMRPEVPMAFFGHSMGATLAFEVALRLRRHFPTSVTRLFVSARRAPADCHPTGRPFLDDAVLMRVMRRPGAPALDEAEWAVLGPPLRNDLLMTERYRHRPGPRLTCPITAITAQGDPTGCTEPEARRWADYTIGSFDAHVMPGDHLYLEDDPAALATFLIKKLGALPLPAT